MVVYPGKVMCSLHLFSSARACGRGLASGMLMASRLKLTPQVSTDTTTYDDSILHGRSCWRQDGHCAEVGG